MKLYRAACDTECEQIIQTRKLELGRNSVAGKWFAESINDARIWGHWFYSVSGVGHDRIIVAEIPENDANRLFRSDWLDNIGPARFASVDQLHLITFVEVTI